jgi:uncharacterized protein
MAVALSYPGVYIDEVPSGVRAITGVSTSITAFIGRARRGRSNYPVRVQSFAEFERVFGGLWAVAPMTYAVQQFFRNGGTDALIVRVHCNGAAATVTRDVDFHLAAASEGAWGGHLRVRIDYDTRPPVAGEAADSLFNLSVKDTQTGAVERFANVSTDPHHRRFVALVLEQESNLIRIAAPGTVPSTRPVAHGNLPAGTDPLEDDASSTRFDDDGDDGTDIGDTEVSSGTGLETNRQGIWALDHADLFNLLCIPPYGDDLDVGQTTWDAATAYAKRRRALVIVDPPAMGWDDPADIAGTDSLDSIVTRHENAAIYFPRVRVADPAQENRLRTFAPCGAVAGVFARTDTARGVWKAPAGTEATLSGVAELAVNLTDEQTGLLNPLGINCLRALRDVGRVVWGARTLVGSDRLASEWKYIPVRRTALYIEESLYRGTQWVVFEPNDEPLWAQIRLNVGAFMHGLFRQGAFAGTTPRDAYFVKCDRETTTSTDQNLGIVNILVGFAPLKPAEFVVIRIQQIAPAQQL